VKILITGGTGFVGTRLTSRLIQDGNDVTVLTRSARGPGEEAAGISYLQGDPSRQGPWQEAVKDHDAVVNLAGASIFSKWTDEQKRAIRESRVSTTRNIVEGISSHPEKRTLLFSASAVGYYGFCGDEELIEASPPGSDFLARVAVEWEGEAVKGARKGARVVIGRFGIILGERGGAFSQMIRLFKNYVGGPIGSGKQWFSWIHINDIARAFEFVLEHPEISGPVNMCSPHPVRNRDLAKALGKALHRPSFLAAPGFMVKLVLGEFGSVILEGQRVVPERLLTRGFSFRYPDIENALRNILSRSPASRP
jgi:uncharacterized protein (TIGR01777 family)